VKDIRAITIDLDDTLWEIHPVIHRAERALKDWLGEHYPRTTELFSPEQALELRRQVREEHADRAHDLTFLRRTVLARMGASAGYGDGLVEAAMEVFNEARNRVEIFPEVRPALTALREKYRLVAVTNGNACLRRIGIEDLFHDFVSASLAGAAKPARRIFEVAVRSGGAPAHQTLHVGDHPEYDVAGARDAGLRTAWVNRKGSAWPDALPQPDTVVAHVGELSARLHPGGR
jgi:putative hydrolase of the HAD superfamily